MKKAKETAAANNEGSACIAEFVRQQVTQYGIKEKEQTKIVMMTEEAAGSLVSHASEKAHLSAQIRSFLGHVTIELSAEGDAYSLTEGVQAGNLLDEDVGEGVQDTLRSIILKSMASGLKYRYTHGKNQICMEVLRSKNAFLYQTLGALAIAILTGMLLLLIGNQTVNGALDTYLLDPVKTMYMNALKMIVAPVVFFSIVTCIMRFTNVSELGRVGGRVLSMYMLTTLIATITGIAVFYLFQPGSPLPSDAMTAAAGNITSQTMNVSIKDTIVGIVPDNFLEPFLSSDMLQVIFLAVVCGITVGWIGRYSETIRNLFDAFNELFLKIMSIVIRFLPLAVFCSITSMILDTGIQTILSVIGMLGAFLFGLLCMILVYMLLLAILGRMNPLPFLKKYAPTMLQVFSTGSSNASIPINMEACSKMGILPKIYTLSIPLGATLNMDGTCVYLGVFALALAKTYGVNVTEGTLLAMVISIIVLSIGAPGIPGSGLICLSMLLAQIGVPTEAVGLVMGIDALVGMVRTMSNCTGDMAVTVLVDKWEKNRLKSAQK